MLQNKMLRTEISTSNRGVRQVYSTAYKLIAILLFLQIEIVAAQMPVNPNRLPLCPRSYSDRYHNCWGNNTDITFKYVGEFQNNTFNGFGSEQSPWGNYIGYFQNGRSDGQGILIYNDGLTKIGEFRNGQLRGRGIIYNSDGSIREQGMYQDNKLVATENINMGFMFPIFNSIFPSFISNHRTNIVNETKSTSSAITFDVAKSKCEELGFKPETEGFGKCVLQLTK